ncbi:MAG: hypothetical protein WC477_02095 [Patescibacteria group bacterium]
MPPQQNGSIGSGFTEGELQFSSFWVRNRTVIHRSIIFILLAMAAGAWGYTLWGILDAYAISYPKESRMSQEIVQNAFVAQQFEKNRPQSIATQSTLVFQGTANRLDMITPIQNPNDQWMATFTYRYNISGEQTPEHSGFILPHQSLYLGEFGYEPKTAGGLAAVLTVNNIVWKRIDPSAVGGDYAAWMKDHDAFVIDNVQTKNESQTGGQNVTRTSFTFKNPTAYGYWTVGVTILLERAGDTIAATYIVLNNVQPGETRDVNVDWYERLPLVTDTQIVPVVNFLDPSVYLPSTRFTQ